MDRGYEYLAVVQCSRITRRRESMAKEGKRTTIKREDAERLGVVEFEGGQSQLYRQSSNADGSVRLELDTFRGPRLALYGFFDPGDEFIEVDRERLD